MKKLLLLLPLALIPVFFSGTTEAVAATTTATTITFDEPDFCSPTFGDLYPTPVPICTYAVDILCYDYCKYIFVTAKALYIAEACQDATQARSDAQDAVELANAQCRSCIESGGNVEECNATWTADIAQIRANHEYAISVITSKLDSLMQGAYNEARDCMYTCCVEEPRPVRPPR